MKFYVHKFILKSCVSSTEIIVGFTEETYTFSEGQSNTFITVAKDGGVVSERTDIAVNISLQGIPTATPGEDFEVIQLNTVVSIDPDDQEVNIPVSILEDLLPEGVESFTLTVARASDGFGFSADRTDTFATTEVFITDNDGMLFSTEQQFNKYTAQAVNAFSKTYIFSYCKSESSAPVLTPASLNTLYVGNFKLRYNGGSEMYHTDA